MWIGTVRFDADVPAIVTLSNRANENVLVDAVKFVPQTARPCSRIRRIAGATSSGDASRRA